MKPLCLLLISILLSVSVYAQHNFKPGFIIQNGETVQGEIDSKSITTNSKKCIFRSPDGVIATYRPTDIQGYYFAGGKRYVSMPFNNDIYFLEFLVEGRISLYYVKENGDRYLISKEGSEMKELVNTEQEIYENNILQGVKQRKEYVGILSALMIEAKALRPEIPNTALEHASLIRLVKKYHEEVCPEDICLSYERKNKTEVSLGPVVGFTNSSLHNYYYNGYTNVLINRDINASNAFSLGTKMNINGIFGISEKICPSVNLLYSSHKYLVEAGNGKPKEEVSTSFIKGGLMINYELFNNRKWTPYLGVGYNVDYFLSNDIFEKVNILEEIEDSYSTKSQINKTANAGIKYALNTKMTLDVCLVYEYGNGIVNPNMSGWTTKTKNISLRVALLFHHYKGE